MKQENLDTKERILNTVVKLLSDRKDVNKITTREIAKLANVNIASINYYFNSKDNLVLKAVETCMENMARKLLVYDNQKEDAVKRIKNMIKEIASFAFNNYYLSEIAISAEIKKGSINTIQTILPLLKELFKDRKTETELKLMALQIITPMQVMFLNANEFKDYLLVDIFDDDIRNELLDRMVENILISNNKRY